MIADSGGSAAITVLILLLWAASIFLCWWLAKKTGKNQFIAALAGFLACGIAVVYYLFSYLNETYFRERNLEKRANKFQLSVTEALGHAKVVAEYYDVYSTPEYEELFKFFALVAVNANYNPIVVNVRQKANMGLSERYVLPLVAFLYSWNERMVLEALRIITNCASYPSSVIAVDIIAEIACLAKAYMYERALSALQEIARYHRDEVIAKLQEKMQEAAGKNEPAYQAKLQKIYYGAFQSA